MSSLTGSRPLASALSEIWRTSIDESAVAVGWSPSRPWLAAAAANGSICIFDGETGESACRWSGHRFGVTRLAWHPQAPLFATAGQDGKVRLWEARLEGLVGELDCGAEWVEHIAWSANGEYLATGAGRKLKLWSKTGDLIRAYPDHPHTIAAIAWSAADDELVSACYGQLQFWAPGENRVQRTFTWKGSMLALAWSPDKRYLCHGNQDATVHFWIVTPGKELQMRGYPTKVRELAWDSRSRYLATGGGPDITVWDCAGKGPANTKPIVLKYHDAPVSRLAYQHSGGLLASGCDGGRLALWKPGKRKVPDLFGYLPGGITDLMWSQDDTRLAVAAEDGSVAVYACD